MHQKDVRPGLLLLGGELFDFPIRPDDWAFIAAADRGAQHALEQGVLPDWVVGDFDSLPEHMCQSLRSAGVPIEQLPVDKDLTDGEAALKRAMTSGVETVVLAGGLGGRFDHTLGNVLLLTHLYDAGLFGWVTDGRQRLFLLRDSLKAPLTIHGEPGDQLSIIPLSLTVEGLTLRGVQWPLRDDTLSFASTRSLSNEFMDHLATLSVRSGLALVAITPARFA